MLTRIYLVIVLLIPMVQWLQGQSLSVTKTGPNTWGGPYVPPKWTKSYDIPLKTYNINVQPATSRTSQSSGSRGGYSSGSYEKKSRWSVTTSNIDYEGMERARQYRDAKAKETAVEYGKKLNEAIAYFNMGMYRICYNTITRVLRMITSQASKTNNNWDEIYTQISKYDNVRNYYEYLSAVKCGVSNLAVLGYNGGFTPNDYYNYYDPNKPDISKLLPFESRYYFFLDNVNANKRPGFSTYTIRQRFLADLYLVELLANLNKKEDGKRIFSSVLDFYLPRIDSMDAFLPQIAINHFYLGNVEEAGNLLEYYWNDTEDYSERLRILNELVNIDDGLLSKNEWSRAKNPEQYAFVKRNYQFLDSIIYGRNLTVNDYNNYVKYRLYVERGDEADLFIQAVEPRMQAPMDSQFYSRDYNWYSIRNNDVELYLMALLHKGDKEKIRETLARITEVAMKQKNIFLAKVDAGLKRIEDYRHAPQVYWKAYYGEKLQPASRALDLFKMKRFAQNGGEKYLREAAKPFLEELSEYTEEEYGFGVGSLEEVGLKPRFLKKRKYPETVPSAVEEKKAAIAKQEEDLVNAEKQKVAEKEKQAREIRETPLTAEEEGYKKMGAPFGALAMYENAVKLKKIGQRSRFDSLAIGYAAACFQRLGYEKGKSLHADILMASIVNDRQRIPEFTGNWGIKQVVMEFYKKPITSAEQEPDPKEVVYEEQFIRLLSRSGQYDSLTRYIESTPWAAGIKFAFPYVEALAITGKDKEALNFIAGGFHKRTYTMSALNDYRGWETLMEGIVLFHKKEYKKAWEQFNGSKVPNNQVSDPEGKWNFPSELYVPRIFTMPYAYYYFCCARELKKKDFKEFLPITAIPMSAPAFLEEKYGNLFSLQVKYH
ncbi:MAG: hypothetical protein IPP31_05145 [Chitinophagaceae bacterium]|nr:hypothetical protein [Chitinophagaceae bacterium]